MLRRTRSAEVADDEGITLVLVALLMVAFMAFAAFAVDFGSLYALRRGDQNAADAAALAGAQELLGSESDIADAVIAFAEEDLGVSGLDWNSCDGDSERLADVVEGQNCISRDEALLRVRTPPREMEAIFGAVLGETGYEHSAFAIAGLTPEGYGGVLPFGLFTSAGGHVCLRTDNPASPVSPCQGSATGDSGVLNLNFYENTLQGTPLDCNPSNSSGPNGRLKNNVASGVDHVVTRRENLGQGLVLDAVDCPDKSDPRPNAADTITSAGAMQGLEIGLFTGDASEFYDDQPARLRRTAQVPYANRAPNVEGIDADSTPLWAFIGAGEQAPTEVPDSCQREVFEDALADVYSLPPTLAVHLEAMSVELRMEKLLERCFAHYGPGGTWSDGSGAGAYPEEERTGCSAPLAQSCSGALFNRDSSGQEPEVYDIQYTPRFGYVPEVWESLGTSPVSYKQFRPVFIQRLCIGNQDCNQGTFSPGVPWVDQGTSTSPNVHAVSAFAFYPSMLPGGLGGEDAPYEVNVNLFLRLVR